MRQRVDIKNVEPPIHPYSLAIKHGNLLFVSGQVARKNIVGDVIDTDFESQARVALDNLRIVVEGAGCKMDDVVMVNVYLRKGEDFPTFNRVYIEYFSSPYPARNTVLAATANPKLLVEVDAIVGLDK